MKIVSFQNTLPSQFSLFSLKVNGIFYESWQVQSPSRVMSLCKTEVSKHPPPPQGQLLSKYSPVGVMGGISSGRKLYQGRGFQSQKQVIIITSKKSITIIYSEIFISHQRWQFWRTESFLKEPIHLIWGLKTIHDINLLTLQYYISQFSLITTSRS